MARINRSFMDLVVSIEEDNSLDLNDGLSADGDIQIDEAIAMEEEIEQINEAATEIESGIDTTEEAMDVADDLQEQVDTTEELIDNNPEAVTDEVVQASQEMFFAALGRLNYSIDQLKSLRVANEGSVPAITRLRISNEAISETIKNIWEKIAQFFKRISAAIKNLYQKAVLFFNSTEKKAKALIDKISKTPKDIEINEELGIKAAKKLGTLNMLTDSSIGLATAYKDLVYNKLLAVLKSPLVVSQAKMGQYSIRYPSNLDAAITKAADGKEVELTILYPSYISVVVSDENGVFRSVSAKLENDQIEAVGKKMNNRKINTSDFINDLKAVQDIAKNFKSVHNDMNKMRDNVYKAMELKTTKGDEIDRIFYRNGGFIANTVAFQYMMSIIKCSGALLSYYSVLTADKK